YPIENCQHTHYLPSQTPTQRSKCNHLQVVRIFLHRGGRYDFSGEENDSPQMRMLLYNKRGKSGKVLCYISRSDFEPCFFPSLPLAYILLECRPTIWPISNSWRKSTPWQLVWR